MLVGLLSLGLGLEDGHIPTFRLLLYLTPASANRRAAVDDRNPAGL